jgi:hypothetical protein
MLRAIGKLLPALGRRVAKLWVVGWLRWRRMGGGAMGRSVAKLAGDGWLSWYQRALACYTAALWVRIQAHLSKIQNGRHKLRCGQHNLAPPKKNFQRFKNLQNTPIRTVRYRCDFHTISRSLGSSAVPVLFAGDLDQCFGPDSLNPDPGFLMNLGPGF